MAGIWTAAALAAGLAGPAAAAPLPTLEVFAPAAQVVVIPEDRNDILVTVKAGRPGAPGLSVTRHGSGVTVRGMDGAPSWIEDLVPGLGGARCTAQGVQRRGRDLRVADLPLVTARVPRQVVVRAKGAVFGRIGQAAAVDLANAGCGRWSVAAVDGALSLSQRGAGQLRAVSGEAVRADLDGKGRIEVAAAWGPLGVQLHGSGVVVVGGGVVSTADVMLRGTGRVIGQGRVATLNARLDGSGSVEMAMVTGRVSTTENGVGEVRWGRPKGRRYCTLC